MTSFSTMRAGLIIFVLSLLVSPTRAAEVVVSREADIGELRLGQRIQVDDGMCPAGQIKEVSGAQLNAAGVARVVKCVPRQGSRR